MSEAQPARRNLDYVQASAGLAVVLFAASGAIFYFVGSQYLSRLARLVGLAAPPKDGSIQVAMAEGARVLVSGGALEFAIIAAGLAVVGAGIAQLPWYKKLHRDALAKAGAADAHRSPTPRLNAVHVLMLMATGFFLIFMFTDGLLKTAQIGAYAEHIAIREDLGGSCSRCRAYETKTGVAKGIPLFQSDEAIFVEEYGSVTVVRFDALVTIRLLRKDEEDKSRRLADQKTQGLGARPADAPAARAAPTPDPH